MIVENATSKKDIDYEPLRHFCLGQDGDGDYHHWDRETETATVITEDGERTFTDHVPEHRLESYREYVRQQRGAWQIHIILPPTVSLGLKA